jgi:hypothetical protein
MPVISIPSKEQPPAQQEALPSGISSSSQDLSRILEDLQSVKSVGVGLSNALLIQLMQRILNGLSLNRVETARILPRSIVQKLESTLTEIYDLLSWPENWNGYDATPPDPLAIQQAAHWIELFYIEIFVAHLKWLTPHVAPSGDGEVIFEWEHGAKNLTIYVGSREVSYVKDWGADMETEMEDGYITSTSTRVELWKWLIN